MHRGLGQCIGELRVNHTDREIAGALSEYFQIVKSVSTDYTDAATVAELRADHPELGFMDDEEIGEILEQAKAMRRKREPDEEYLIIDDMRELFRRNKNWGDIAKDPQKTWIMMAATNGMVIRDLACMVWVCTKYKSIENIEQTMREYLKEKREKEQGSTGWSTEGYDVGFAEECIKVHMDAFNIWPYGDVEKIEMDEDGDLRVRYAGGMCWHYREDDDRIVWW